MWGAMIRINANFLFEKIFKLWPEEWDHTKYMQHLDTFMNIHIHIQLLLLQQLGFNYSLSISKYKTLL